MMKRLLLLVWTILLATALVACGEAQTSAPSAGEPGAAEGGTAETAAEPAGPTVIEASTARESSALDLAASEDGRKWAMGNPDGSAGSAAGDPFIIGYQTQFAEGDKMHSVVVIGGQVSRFFGAPGGEFTTKEAVVSGTSATGTLNYVAPEGAEQEKAVAAAREYLEANGYGIGDGGIEGIVIVFPRIEDGGQYDGQDPGVTVFAKDTLGDFASGGPAVRY